MENIFRFFILLFFYSCISGVNAQNLVPNPGFEIIKSCPADYGMAEYATGWGNFSASPDLFNKCTNGNTGIPENLFGTEPAASGKAYAGLVVYHYEAANEIIGAKLLEPLQAGARYEVSFKISLGEKYSKYASNGLGVLFTDDPASTFDSQKAHLKIEEIIRQTEGWVTMKRVFTADKMYTHIAIGNFFNRQNTKIELINADANIDAAYYYIDDISVIKTDKQETPTELTTEVTTTVEEKTYIRIYGKVMDQETKKPLKGQIKMTAGQNAYQSYENSDELNGEYQFLNMPVETKFEFDVQAKGYFGVKESVENPMRQDLNKDFYLIPLKVGQKIILNNIYFDFGTAVLKPESYPELNKLIKILKDNPAMVILIGGHTDAVGTEESNLSLSDQRAASVVAYIKEKGMIEPNRLSSKGYGEGKPITENDTDEGRAKNRRVEFEVLKM